MTEFAVDGVDSPRGQGTSRWRIWLSLAVALLCVVLGGLGGFEFHKKSPVEYSASATVLVLPTAAGLDSSVAGNRSQTDVQIATEAELLRSSLVADAASKLMKGALSAKQLLKNSVVTVPPNSQVLMVSLVAGTPANGNVGPDLTHVGSRLNPDQIYTQISDPMKRPAPYATPPQSSVSMPTNSLTPQQRADITAWLATLK